MAETTTAPTLELLAWISRRPRTYAETLEAWRSTCPRLSVWDDAVIEGLVRIERDGPASRVTLTASGRALLDVRA